MNLNMVQRSLLAYQQQLGSGNGGNGGNAGNGRDGSGLSGLLYNDVPAGASALAGLGATSLLHQRIMAGMGASAGALQQQSHRQHQQIQPTNTSPFNGVEAGLPQGIAAALQHMTPDQRAATLAHLLGSSATPPVGGLLGALGAGNPSAGASSSFGLQQQQQELLLRQQQQQQQRSTTPATSQSGKRSATPSQSPQILNSFARDSPGFSTSASGCGTPSRAGMFPSAATLVNEDKIPPSHLLAAAAAATGNGAGFGLLGSGMMATGAAGLPNSASVLEQQRLHLLQLEEQQQRRRLQQEQHRLFASLRAAAGGDGDDNEDDGDDAMSVDESRACKKDAPSSVKRKMMHDSAVVIKQRRTLTADGTTSIEPLKGGDTFDISDQSFSSAAKKMKTSSRSMKSDEAWTATDAGLSIARDVKCPAKSGSLPLRKRGPKAQDRNVPETIHDEEPTEEEEERDEEEDDEVAPPEGVSLRPKSLETMVVSLIDEEVEEEERKASEEEDKPMELSEQKTASDVFKEFPNYRNAEGFKRLSTHSAEKKKWRGGGRRYLPGRSPALPGVTNGRASGLTKKQRQIVKQQHNHFATAITRKRRKMATLIEMHLIQILSNEAEREETERKQKEGGQSESLAAATRVLSTKRHQPMIVDPLRSGKVLKLRRPAFLATALENRLWEASATEAEYDDISSLPARLRMVCMTVARRIERVAHSQRQPQESQRRPETPLQGVPGDDPSASATIKDAVVKIEEATLSPSHRPDSEPNSSKTRVTATATKVEEPQAKDGEFENSVSEKTASPPKTVFRRGTVENVSRSPSVKGNARATAA